MANFKADKLCFSLLDSILILPVVLIKEQLQKPQMKTKVAKERKEVTRSQTEANFSKGNSVLDIAMFCNLNDVKNPFTARMLSYEVLNLVNTTANNMSWCLGIK